MFKQEKIDELYPGALIYGAMRFWSLPKNKTDMIEEMCSNGQYYAQTKKDGNWYQYSKSSKGVPYLFSRGTSVKTNLPVEGIEKTPHIAEAFKELPNETVIIGEIYYPGKTSAAVRSIMGCLPPKAIERQRERGNIHFFAHDILAYNGEDLTEMGSLDRYKKLVRVFEKYNLASEVIELADCVKEDIYGFLAGNFKKGEEGSILKKKDAPYAEGKSPAWSSIKWKKQDDVDLICTGVGEPTKYYTGTEIENWQYWEYQGEKKEGDFYGQEGYRALTRPYFFDWKTSIVFGLYDEGKIVEVGSVSSGLNNKLREKLSTNTDDYIGKVFKCNYMELTDDAIREPIFIEFRDDKPAEECTIQSVFQ